jgi:hypothetical protein
MRISDSCFPCFLASRSQPPRRLCASTCYQVMPCVPTTLGFTGFAGILYVCIYVCMSVCLYVCLSVYPSFPHDNVCVRSCVHSSPSILSDLDASERSAPNIASSQRSNAPLCLFRDVWDVGQSLANSVSQCTQPEEDYTRVFDVKHMASCTYQHHVDLSSRACKCTC